MVLHKNILQTIGRTPVVRLNRIAPANVNLFVKCEFFNPLSSVKDRLAIAAVEDAERSGLLKPGQTIVEATSGNTGISLAMVCAAKGYPLVCTMAESFSIERRKLMKFLGAKVVLTPAAEKGSGMVRKAEELAAKYGYFQTTQFANPANPEYHRNTTGPEILLDFAHTDLDYWVSGWGTGGTITGAGQMIKLARPATQIVAVEPENAKLLSGEEWSKHMIQGWTPDFLPSVLDRTVFDQLAHVSDADAIQTAKDMATKEGIFCGISGGATVAAAIALAQRAKDGATILAMVPDTGERYLSTPLFANITEESDEASLV